MLNIAIIGCGAVVQDLHVPPLRTLQRRRAIRVRALVDPSAERLARLRGEFPEATPYAEVQSAIEAEEIHLTLIASPPRLHLEHGLAALGAGSHVLIEKPMVTSSVEAQTLTAAAARADRILAVGMTRRFFPGLAEVSTLVSEGLLGGDVSFRFFEGAPYDWPVASEAAFRRKQSGGGVLMDKGVHALDMLDNLFGEGHVVGSWDDALGQGVEANARVSLGYTTNPAQGRLQLSWDQPLNNGLWIRGSEAEVWLGGDDITLYRMRQRGAGWQQIVAQRTWPSNLQGVPRGGMPTSYYDCIYYQWISVARAVLFGESVVVNGEKAARVIRMIETAYAKAEVLLFPWQSPVEQQKMTSSHWRKVL